MFRRRVLLLTETYPPEVGGIQHYLGGLFRALPEGTGMVIAPDQPNAAGYDREASYPIVRTRMRAWSIPRWRPALAATRDALQQFRPEVLVVGKALFEGRAALALQTEQRRSPTTYHLPPTPYIVCTYAMEIGQWLRKPKPRRDLQRVLAGAARVVVINARVKDRLRGFGVPEEKFVKIYPGVDEEHFADIDGVEEFRHRHSLEGTRVLLTVGRLIPRKGIDLLLRALPDIRRAVPDSVLVIVGDGPERARLTDLARTLGIDHAVRVLGEVPPEDLRCAYRVADLFVLTPREVSGDEEGFGVVYLEAAAAGRAAVGSRSGGVPEAVLDGKTGVLVPPEDPGEIARAVVTLLHDDALRTRMAAAAQARAQREFSWATRGLLFRGMLEAVVQEQRAMSPSDR